MDSYEILGVGRDADDKQIEICYEDLKKKYDPGFNTSISAYKKYREILKAYEDIKSESRRKMYQFKDTVGVKEKVVKSYKLFDYSSEVKKVEEVKIDYDNLVEVKELVKEDVVLTKKISYLYYLLNLKVDLTYSRDVLCDECDSFVKCNTCDGKGIVYYKEKQVYCPKCHGKGEISCVCPKCDDEGVYKKLDTVSLVVDNEVMVLKNLGNEYYDFSKSNLIVNFDFYDKDSITVENDTVYVSYRLSSYETINGIKREYYGETSAFTLDVPSYVENKYSQEVVFNNKRIIFTFYNDKIKGENKKYCLFINKKYQGQDIYFNSDYSKCSDIKDSEYFNVVSLVNRDIVIDGYGLKGKYGGDNGNLIIKCIFTRKGSIEYRDDVEIIETSKMFNLLGGNVNGVNHYGFRGDYCLVNAKNKHYLFTGRDDSKEKMKNYFLFKIVCILLWLIIPLIYFMFPYGEEMFMAMLGAFVGFFALANFVMEVKI